MDSQFIVLGLGADPRIYPDCNVYALPFIAPEAPAPPAVRAVLTYRERQLKPDPEYLLWILEFLLEGGLELVIELLFLGWS